MREIKFRAWDNVKDRMYCIGEESDIVFSFDSSGITAIDIREDDDNFKNLHHLQYMQYTGLKDKNGKEYYEGDICVQSNDRKKGAYTVVWQDNGFKLEIIVRRKYEGSSWNEKVHVPIFPNSYEIIGNIYENTELLAEVTP